MKLFTDDTGRVLKTDGPPPAGSPCLGGLAFNNVGQVYRANASASDVYVGGWRVSVLGELIDADTVGNTPFVFNAGMPQASGAGANPAALMRQIDTIPNAADPFVAGVRVGNAGAGVFLTTAGPPGSSSTFDPAAVGGITPTFSNGNLTITGPGTSQGTVRGTTSKSSGKWYFEMSATGPATNLAHKVGVIKPGTIPTELGSNAISYSYYRATSFDGSYYNNGVPTGTPPTIPANAVVMVAVDIDAGKLWFGLNGTWQGDPVAGTGQAFTGVTGQLWPAGNVLPTGVLNFKPTSALQTYPAPSGYSAWG